MALAKPFSPRPARLSCPSFASTTARSAMGRQGPSQPRCARNFTVTQSGAEGGLAQTRRLCPQLMLAPPADVACNGRVRVLLNVSSKNAHSDLAISLAGRGPRARKWNNGNGGRPLTKSSGHLPQPRPQEQDPAHDFSSERSEAPGRCNLVR